MENQGPYHERRTTRFCLRIGSRSDKYFLKYLIWEITETSGWLETLKERIWLSRVRLESQKPTVLWACSADIVDLSSLRTSGLGTSRRFIRRPICLLIVVCRRVSCELRKPLGGRGDAPTIGISSYVSGPFLLANRSRPIPRVPCTPVPRTAAPSPRLFGTHTPYYHRTEAFLE